MKVPFVVYDPKTLNQVQPAMHPYLKDRLAERAKWMQPQPQKEPLTYRVILALAKFNEVSTLKEPFLSCEALVYDTACLGCFTGSRISEYGQRNLARGERFATVPNDPNAGAWAGWPLAFIRDDFKFFTPEFTLIPTNDVVAAFRAKRVRFLQIRFRFDKSPRNFSFRKFATTNDRHLDAVTAGVRILHRANMLKVPSNEPICAFRRNGALNGYAFLRDYHVIPILWQAVISAYPDPNHYLCLNVLRVVTHSHRVTAALCLKLAGESNEAIAWKLRWHVGSVPTYLRDCFMNIGEQVTKTLTGALQTAVLEDPNV